MVLIVFNLCKRSISYNRAKLKKVGDFYVLTWLIFAGPDIFDSCNMGTSGLPDMYAQSPRAAGPRAEGIHIRQITSAHVTTIM